MPEEMQTVRPSEVSAVPCVVLLRWALCTLNAQTDPNPSQPQPHECISLNANAYHDVSPQHKLVNDALDKFSIEKDIATHMKKQFDEKHQDGDKDATWCVVGKSLVVQSRTRQST